MTLRLPDAPMPLYSWQEEIRRLCCQYAHMVLFLLEAIQKDGAVVPEGIKGDHIRQAAGIMNGPIINELQSGAASVAVELELW